MQLTRREFLQDIAFVAAVAGLPTWATNLDEMPPSGFASTSRNNPWSWNPPSAPATVDPALVVLNRLAFGPRPGDFESVQKMGVDAYIDEQLNPESIDDSALEQKLAQLYPTLKMSVAELMRDYPQVQRKLPQNLSKPEKFELLLEELGLETNNTQPPAQVANELQDATLMRAIYSKRQLQETLVDFWSNHFTIYIGKNDCKWAKTVDDREVIRKYAFGKFGDMLRASAQSPAMLEYLDNKLNVKGVANENYAREIMELHTLGVDGGYTQKDVQELARAFTGWTYQTPKRANFLGGIDYTDAGKFLFDASKHDTGPKKILGVVLPGNGGINEALQIIDVLAHHSSTAKFIATKLVRRFVSDTPPDALVQRATHTFMQTGGDIRAVLSTILHSDDFGSFAQKIKRPFELIVSTLRATDAQVEDVRAVSTALRAMGQGLFLHVTPDGYPDDGSEWINTGALLSRWNISLLAARNQVPKGKIDYKTPTAGKTIKTIGDAVDFWTNYLLHRPIPDADRQKIIDALGKATANFDANRLPDLVALILASPHFQYR
jgi:uncharacterized protein (DUF1800 family)